jgi:hypothetical protein
LWKATEIISNKIKGTITNYADQGKKYSKIKLDEKERFIASV